MAVDNVNEPEAANKVIINVERWRVVAAVATVIITVVMFIIGTSWKLSTELGDYRADIGKQILLIQERQTNQQTLMLAHAALIKDCGDGRLSDRDRLKTLEVEILFLKNDIALLRSQK